MNANPGAADGTGRRRALPAWTAYSAVAAVVAWTAFIVGDLERFEIPYAWCALAWAGACFVVAAAGSNTTARSIVFNIGFVFLVPGLFELESSQLDHLDSSGE